MGLREDAERDLEFILEDEPTGGGWSITVTDPDGNTAPLTGWSADIGQLIDPDTGVAVSGRLATVALRIASLATAGLVGLPEAIADPERLPWRIAFDDINGNAHRFKVQSSHPDRSLGVVTCTLELYE